MKILKKHNINDKDLRIIQNWNQSVNINIGTEYSKNKRSLKNEVRQDCASLTKAVQSVHQ